MYPINQRQSIGFSRCAKQVHVIRHNNVSSNQPRIRSDPRFEKERISTGASKYWLSILGAHRHEYDYWGVELLSRGKMQWVLTIRVVHLSEGRPPCRPESVCGIYAASAPGRNSSWLRAKGLKLVPRSKTSTPSARLSAFTTI